jgi:hypothetical protein
METNRVFQMAVSLLLELRFELMVFAVLEVVKVVDWVVVMAAVVAALM